MRYLRKCRIAALAGLASLVVAGFAAAPAGATVTCTGTSPYQSCTTTISLSVKVSVTQTSSGPAINVKVTVTDPFVTVKLYRKQGTTYKLVKTVFKGNLTGTKKFHIHPKKAGRYELKVKASANGVSKTVKKFFKVP